MIVKSREDSSSPSTSSPSSVVRRSAKFIAGSSSEVTINHNAVGKLAHLLADRYNKHDMSPECWKDHELHPKTADASAVDW